MLKGEVETWLDIAPVYLKEIVFTLKKMNDNLGGKRNQMICKQDELLLTAEAPSHKERTKMQSMPIHIDSIRWA
jgi:hypothetical protein